MKIILEKFLNIYIIILVLFGILKRPYVSKNKIRRKMSKRTRLGLESRDHNYTEKTSTTFEVVGKHGAEYKKFFESFISSDASLKNVSVPQIIAAIKTFASAQGVDTKFDSEISSIRSITMLLNAASCVESSRVIKNANNWSILPLARVEPVISKLLAVTSKRHLNELRRKSAGFDSLNVILHVCRISESPFTANFIGLFTSRVA